jgi:hypothetical protein
MGEVNARRPLKNLFASKKLKLEKKFNLRANTVYSSENFYKITQETFSMNKN